ncbi:Winged helix DNA-binding domain-containing protein [Nonomuraea maritima]|uniref:Winged helix DNA-binding domain-containing protein n=1 Tax=Nonomuraea maritima TaxID=683260 RepID=A0A1G9DAE0_9ACTN|nr:Winged helix DNA-binding domain-containing protein [Nonomuraea maritima]
MIELSWSQVSARRLERARLLVPWQDVDGLGGVVAAMCGAHAQIMSAAEASVGLRARVTRSHVRDALWTSRSLVKTYGPRGTVHLLPTADLPRWAGALASIPHTGSGSVRLTPEQTARIVAAVRDAVQERPLTIDELDAAVVAAIGPWAGDLVMPAFGGWWPRWRQAMGAAAHRGAFVFGPPRGRKVTYAAAPMAGPAADGLAWLVRSYLTAYGPATPAQFAQWAGGRPRWAAEAFSQVELEEVRLEGQSAWVLAGDTGTPDERPRGVLLLPYFDAYVVAGRPRELLYPGAAARRALSGGQAGNFPVVLVDGEVAGVWHARRAGSRIDLTVELLRDLTPAQSRGLEEQAERFGTVTEAKPRLTLGPVTVGPHA